MSTWTFKNPPVLTLLDDSPLRDYDRFPECFDLPRRMGTLYDAIRHHEMGTPFAAMVSGGWGSGKTSAMHWLDRQLTDWSKYEPTKKEKEQIEKKIDVDTCWFHPWKYDTKEDVWKGLIAEVILASVKRRHNDMGLMARAAHTFGSYFGPAFVRALSSITLKGELEADAVVGKAKGAVEFSGKEFAGIIDDWSKNVEPQKAFYNQFETVLRDWMERAYDKDRRLCIFIDDLDRCMPDIALQVLESLKLYLNIHNLVFVVGVDKSVIEKIVAKRYEDMVGEKRMEDPVDDGESFATKAGHYLDKMFQIEVDIQPDEERIGKFLEERLKRVSWWDSIDRENKKWLNFAIQRTAKHNPRSVVRKLNQWLSAAGSSAEPLVRVQCIAASLVAEACAGLHDPAYREYGGRRFFHAWSRVLAENADGANYLGAGSEEWLLKAVNATAKEQQTDNWAHLRPLAKDFSKYEHLLKEEELGFLMRLPYPEPMHIENVTVIHGQKVVASSDESFDWVGVLRPIVAKAKGIAEEQVDENYLKALTSLTLPRGAADDNVLQAVSSLTSLTLLGLPASKFTDAGLAHIANLPQLQTLSMESAKIGDEGIEHLRGLTPLINLFINGTRVTGKSLTVLAELPNLEALDVGGTRVEEQDLKLLGGFPKLDWLAIDSLKITKDGFALAAGLKRLITLYASNLPITDDWLKLLHSHPNLKSLYVSQTKITDASVDVLSSISTLTILHIRNTEISSKGVAEIQRRLPDCEISR